MADISGIGYASIITYVSFCLIFFTIKYVYFAEDNLTWIILFILLSFILQLMNNITITEDPAVCGNMNVSFAIYHTAIPWFFVLTVTALLLYAFPGWLRVFSNTFGLYAAHAYGLQDIINQIFTPQIRLEVEGNAKQAMNISLLKSIDNVYSNPSTILNELDPKTFTRIELAQLPTDYQKYNNGLDDNNNPIPVTVPKVVEWESLNKLVPTFLKISPSQILIEQLYNMTLLRDTIGYFVWFILVGSLCSMISVNSILTEPCNSTKKGVFDIIFNNT